jgi:hypothetical protein
MTTFQDKANITAAANATANSVAAAKAIADANKTTAAIAQQNVTFLESELGTLTGIFNIRKRANAEADLANAKLEKELAILKTIDVTDNAGYQLQLKEVKLAEEKIKKLEKQEGLQKRIYDLINQQTKLQAGWIKGLNESDRIIRQTILGLGMSGKKADQIRNTFEKSSMAVAKMGGSLEDIQQVMQGFADETGRSRVFTDQMVTDVIKIGRGTSLGTVEATKMAAQFELMGIDTTKTFEMSEKFVNESEKYGINTAKAFKNVNDNFKKLVTYNFKGGVEGMMKMSAYATKMNIDFSQAFNAIDTAKSLEGAIDLAANLQVMGGEFAKSDPFEMLFLSRNDPTKFTEKINEMTKGVVTFKREADGSYTKFISPADRDRMASVEKSLGLQNGELTQQALRMADIMKMRNNMIGSGMSGDDKSVIEGAAIFNSKTGQFQVTIGTTAKNIANLTESEAKLFVQQQATLEKRTEDSMTFEEALQATLASFKTILLPMLQGFNSVMQWVIPKFEKIATLLRDNISVWFVKIVGAITAAAVLLNIGATALLKVYTFATGKTLMGAGAGIGGSAGGAGLGGRIGRTLAPSLYNAAPAVGTAGGSASQTAMYNASRRNLAAGQASQAAGKGKMMAGAGIGAAAVGIGAGIGVAALGIGKLADSMAKLDATQIAALPWVITSLGVAFAAFTIPLIFVTQAAAAGSIGLWSLGGAALGIGAGIGIAAAGIGYMATGLATLVTAAKGSGDALLDVGKGIGAIGLALTTTGFGALFGSVGLVTALSSVALFAPAIERVGAAFGEINTAMHGSAADYAAVANAVESISKMNTKNGSAFAELATLLKTPLKVEFADKNISLNANITLDIDGTQFTNKVINVPLLVNRMKGYSLGRTTG